MAVAREVGPANLNLRKVAEALGVPRTTIYNHVRSPQELGRLVLTSILEASFADADDHPRVARGWQSRLEAFAVRQRAAQIAAGPWLRFYDPDVHISNETLRAVDELIGMLVDEGHSVETAGHALGLVSGIVERSVRAHSRLPAPSEGDALVARMSAEDLPFLAAARSVEPAAWEETQFRYELRCALVGIGAVDR